MDALKKAAGWNGVKLSHIGVKMGKSHQYVNAIISQHSNPQANTLSKMFDVCGYKLCAVPADRVNEDYMLVIE